MSKGIMCEDGITIKRFEFPSSNRYTEIHGMMWIPQGDVKAVLQIAHGMAEHIERYDEFARYMAKQGILVVGNNHMGHGDSINFPEDLGYFSIPIKGMNKKDLINNDSSASVVKDVHHIVKIVKKHYPAVPYILLGHSMGSFIVRRFLMTYDGEIDGVVIMGTGSKKEATVRLGMLFTKVLTLVKGERYRSRLIDKIMFGAYNRRINHPSSANAWLSSDEEELKKYEEDPLCGFTFTLNGIEALLSTIKFISNEENIEKVPKDVSMLITSGAEDPVGNYGEDVKEVYETYKNHGVKNIKLELYDGCRHEILNEKIRKTVYEDIYGWIIENVVHKQ